MSGSNQSRNTSATNKMLIDATHPEETRVVVLRQGRVEEFDYESAARKLLRGNIYLAKVTRVEPSLQAAFVDYGGNRHGFLAFNEIHPDYYQIPVADRRALIEAEAAAEAEDEAEEERAVAAEAARRQRRRPRPARGQRDGRSQQKEAGADTAVGDAEDSALDVSHLLPPEDVGGHDGGPENEHDAEAAADQHEIAPDMAAVSTGSEPAPGGAAADDGVDTGAGPVTRAERAGADPVLHGEVPTRHGRGDGVRYAATPEPDAPIPASPYRSDIDALAEAAAASASGAHPGDRRELADAYDSNDNDNDNDHRNGDHNPDDADAGRFDDAPRAIGMVEEEGVTELDADNDADRDGENGNGDEPEQVETVADEDALEEVPYRPRRRLRSYKIQEVIKRRQVILIQVVKEERGTKGAALTSYLSLAGRYTVLMPNTARGGGISRKITNAQDRKRLKEIAGELDVPEGMGLIIRTAGASRTKQEIKRDYDYLLRLWESVRELAISSNAPTLVYEEGNLIKRSIRDLYGKEVDEVVVAGDVAYREAKDFMRMLMPSHAKNVIAYADPEPLFSRYQIERQLNAMFSPYVNLKSGGYLVINQTEALVSIDINSGKSTREFSIEETALSTNLEASDEIARQLKLRDLAGLIVIDFIDMEEKRNNRAVERRLKDALRFDRARIQVGYISHFGLMEMSRQRLRTGVLEGSTTQCPHCQGTGVIRSTESVALAVLRGLEDSLMAGQPTSLIAATTASVALYILNHKRGFIIEMENRYGISIHIQASDKMQGATFSIERQPRRDDQPPRRVEQRAVVNMEWGFDDEEEDAGQGSAASAGGVTSASGEDAGGSDAETQDGRKRRRRRRRGRRDDQPSASERPNGHHRGDEPGDGGDYHAGRADYSDDVDQPDHDVGAAENSVDPDQPEPAGQDDEGRPAGDSDSGEDKRGRRGRRRGRRGGRRGGERDRLSADGSGNDDSGNDDSGNDDEPMSTDTGGEASERTAEAEDQSSDGDLAAVGSGRPVAAEAQVSSYDAAPVRHDQSRHATSSQDTPVTDWQQRPDGDSERAIPAHLSGAAADLPLAASAADLSPAAPEPDRPLSANMAEADEIPAPAGHNARTEPVASEPVLERVMVGDSTSAVGADADDNRPARRGWWQRR